MGFKISFQGMEHSDLLEGYARKKVEKMDNLLKRGELPRYFEFHLKSHPSHANKEVVIHLKAKNFDISTKSEQPDIYLALDEAADKLSALIKKEKERDRDFYHKVMTDKRRFTV